MHGKDSDLDVPNIQLYPSTTGFFEHKKCFKQCVSSMETPYLSQLEEECSSTNYHQEKIVSPSTFKPRYSYLRR